MICSPTFQNFPFERHTCDIPVSGEDFWHLEEEKNILSWMRLWSQGTSIPVTYQWVREIEDIWFPTITAFAWIWLTLNIDNWIGILDTILRLGVGQRKAQSWFSSQTDQWIYWFLFLYSLLSFMLLRSFVYFPLICQRDRWIYMFSLFSVFL